MEKYQVTTLSKIQKIDPTLLTYGSHPKNYERAILGIAPTPTGFAVAYDFDTLVELEEAAFTSWCKESSHEACDHWTEALEFVGPGNQPYAGPQSYLIVPRQCDEHEALAIACPCPLYRLDTFGGARDASAKGV